MFGPSFQKQAMKFRKIAPLQSTFSKASFKPQKRKWVASERKIIKKTN